MTTFKKAKSVTVLCSLQSLTTQMFRCSRVPSSFLCYATNGCKVACLFVSLQLYWNSSKLARGDFRGGVDGRAMGQVGEGLKSEMVGKNERRIIIVIVKLCSAWIWVVRWQAVRVAYGVNGYRYYFSRDREEIPSWIERQSLTESPITFYKDHHKSVKCEQQKIKQLQNN